MPSQFAGEGGPPVKWSFSSAVTTKSVLLSEMPSLASKKLAKGLVINLQLLDIARFAWPKGLFGCRKRNTRESGAAVVVGVRNIAIDYRHARLEHRRKVTQCLRRRRAEPRKPWVGWTGVIGDNIAVEVRNRPLRGDLRLYIDVAKERGEAGVTTRLVVQRVGSAVGCGT